MSVRRFLSIGILCCSATLIFGQKDSLYTSLEDAFKNPKEVYQLHLAQTGLNVFPDSVLLLPNLTYLDLQWNKIEELPKKIAKLKKLEILNLEHNDIKDLPNSIIKLKNLKELNLAFCYLEDLPEGMENLKQLKNLNLMYNEFNSRPKWAIEKKDLKLNILGNPLDEDYAVLKASIDKSKTTFVDQRDEEVYNIVVIGKQTWMTENLRYASPNSEIKEGDPKNYGRYYHWEEAQEVCPSGWHLPTKEDVAQLMAKINYDFPYDSHARANQYMKDRKGFVAYNDVNAWFDPNEVHYNGSEYLKDSQIYETFLWKKIPEFCNIYGFSILPAMKMDLPKSRSRLAYLSTSFWIKLADENKYGLWSIPFQGNNNSILLRKISELKARPRSVRCLKNED